MPRLIGIACNSAMLAASDASAELSNNLGRCRQVQSRIGRRFHVLLFKCAQAR